MFGVSVNDSWCWSVLVTPSAGTLLLGVSVEAWGKGNPGCTEQIPDWSE